MSHEAWLALAILGVVLFLGNIIVTPVWKLLADRTQSPPVVAYAQQLVTVTDVAFTATGVVLIIVSGQVMAEDYGGVLAGPAWLTWGWSLFIASGVIWAAALIPIEVAAGAARAGVPRFRDDSAPLVAALATVGRVRGNRSRAAASQPLLHDLQAHLIHATKYGSRMYAWIVARVIRSAFGHLNRRDPAPSAGDRVCPRYAEC